MTTTTTALTRAKTDTPTPTYTITGDAGTVTYSTDPSKVQIHRNDGHHGGEGHYAYWWTCALALKVSEETLWLRLEDEYVEHFTPTPTADTVTPEDFEFCADSDGAQDVECPVCHWSAEVPQISLRLALRIARRHIEDEHRPLATMEATS